jgi:uncharacterized protein (DUF305 family)
MVVQPLRVFVGLALVAAFGVACAPATGTPPPPATLAPAVPLAAAVPTPTTLAALATAIPAAATTAQAALPEFDRLFIDMMVPHHEGALAMARIALERADRPELRQMADDILRTQDAEITQMRQWRREWFGSDVSPPMNQMPMLPGMSSMAGHAGQTMDMAADVERLRSASEPFDLAFIDAMIPHHQSGIDAARVALRQSSRPEVKDLALAIIEAQQREIGQMRAWRSTWAFSTTSASTTPTPGSGGHGQEVPGEDMNH